MTDSLRELDRQIAEEIFGQPHWTPFIRSELEGEPCGTFITQCPSRRENHLRYHNKDKAEEQRNSQKPKSYSVDISASMEVVELMYKEHHLSCRIAYCNDQQVSVAFYTAAGAQHILTEKMDVKGWDTSGTVPLAICRAALQAKITLDGLKEIEDRQKPVDDNV